MVLGVVFTVGASVSSNAYPARFYAVEAQVQAQRSPAALIFSWAPRDDARGYTIRRKSANDHAWGATIANLPGNAGGFTDSNVSAGAAYEYEIRMESRFAAPEGGFIYAYSYLWAGIDVTERHSRGRVILIVDSSVAGALTAELDLFRQNLIGAGWSVVQREVSRTARVTDVKTVIRNEYNAAPGNTRSVILIGQVPVPYSGNIAPDMHSTHKGAWPADAYYADMDGTWTDHTVSIRSIDNAENDNLPGDGKFDQSVMPSAAELEVGRIDFRNLTDFAGKSEIDLLRNYFRKNNAFRHRQFTAPRQGLVRDNFGDFEGDAPAVDAWRHYSGFFGRDRAREIGPGNFFSALANEGYLWAYGCGGGANDKADSVGTTRDFAANDPRAVFLMLHGSYFGDWNYPNNFLRAAIATPNYTLASIWTGLPHWFMHHMALGETIGYSTKLTLNNLTLYRSHRNFSPGEVHVSLIGDPTLEMFPVRPPSNLAGSAGADIRLTWSPSGDDDIAGYHVYHATAAQGPYTRLSQQAVAGTSFSHNVGTGLHYYMVRALKLERTGSGTFFNLSQGVFTSVAKSSGGISTPGVSVVTEDGDAAEFRANSGSFRFTRDAVDGNSLTVFFNLGGAAENGVDYLPVGDSLTIPGGAASAILTIYPRSDNLLEGDETVTVEIRPQAAYRIVAPATASFVIRDNPPAVNQSPTISSIGNQVINQGATREVTFTVFDPESPAGTLTVRGISSNTALIPNGNLQFGGSGGARTLRIVPIGTATGSSQLTVSVSDGALEASTTFTVTVPANQPPTAQAQTVNATEDVPVPIILSGSDPEGANLTYRVVSGPSRGSISGTAPLLVYLAGTNYFGTDSFTFTVHDGVNESAPATISIVVAPVNDPPIAVNDTVESTERGNTISASVLLANDSDPDGDTLTVVSVSNRSVRGGTVLLSGTNILYTPAPGFTGADSFTYTVRDPAGSTASATVSVVVLARPSITGVSLDPNGIRIRFSGPPGRAVLIEASPDTATWSSLGTVTIPANGLGDYLDPEARQIPMRIYRLDLN